MRFCLKIVAGFDKLEIDSFFRFTNTGFVFIHSNCTSTVSKLTFANSLFLTGWFQSVKMNDSTLSPVTQITLIR